MLIWVAASSFSHTPSCRNFKSPLVENPEPLTLEKVAVLSLALYHIRNKLSPAESGCALLQKSLAEYAARTRSLISMNSKAESEIFGKLIARFTCLGMSRR